MLTGRADEMIKNEVHGWAFNTEQPAEHLVIRIMRGTQVIASGVANIMRPDLPEAGVGDGDHAFKIPVPANVTSFDGLMIIAQSQRAGEIPLPIATTEQRRLDDLFHVFSQQYDEALIALKEEMDAIKMRQDSLEDEDPDAAEAASLPDDIARRLEQLETRMESAEVFFVRIDAAVRQMVDEKKKSKKKRFFGIF